MANQWLRLWHDMPNDPKWRTVARVSGQPISTVISVYLHVLVNASNATERGRTQGLNSEDIASALDVQASEVESILSAMQGRVLESDRVSGWEKRQPSREDGSADRAKAWRERNRTQPNAQERPDKDKDKEEDKTKKNSAADRDVGFERFWETWPASGRKAAKGKCLEAWRKAKAEKQVDQIVAHVEQLKTTTDWQKEGGQFIPAPLVYLNNRRWEGASLQDGGAGSSVGFFV